MSAVLAEATEPDEPRPLLRVAGLARRFILPRTSLFGPRPELTAVADVSFDLAAGETLAVVGESGCGKSTVGNLVLNLLSPSAGSIRFDGEDLAAADDTRWRDRRRDLQLIFQDSRSALDPRLTVEAQVAEGLEIHKVATAADRKIMVAAMLEAVGLGGDLARRYPHELSGGQQQRAVIARALVLEPKLVVCDEPVAALDVSVQAQVVNLLRDLQRNLGLAYLFISHDLSLVRHVADRVAVMYLGRFVEVAECRDLFAAPAHPYARALIGAVPAARSRRGRLVRPLRLEGEPPSPMNPPSGCPLHPRCPFATDVCRTELPALRPLADGRSVACHHAEASQADGLEAQGGSDASQPLKVFP
ncbi:ABC transporter ATP-binding protein [Thalassobaculum salexigens]|uniref:ABC transporter ATP-binding protein n=1 Tax=Thalassobaculum salexigens TaxID=455360 RepID=UPI00248E9301|nr:oligopeptide/dipeptide ABC transporter ATP-binding protein [Thalassobaculum salexigens]